jgi:hypothetical protein
VKRLTLSCTLALAACGMFSAGALAAKPDSAGTKLRCFSDLPATCTVDASSASATLDTSNGGDAGVYINNAKNVSGSLLGAVSFSFGYSCSEAAPCVSGGSPRWSIPVDSNGDSKTDAYAFVDAANCGQSGNAAGTVGDACTVYYDNTAYSDWAAFADANPAYTVGNALPFVIADGPFTGTISDISISKA